MAEFGQCETCKLTGYLIDGVLCEQCEKRNYVQEIYLQYLADIEDDKSDA